MKFKRLTAVFIAVLMCMLALTAGAGAAEVKKSISLNKTKATMYVGSSYTLKPTVTGYSKYSLQWSTSDKSVISVKAGGKVTAKKAGTATVTVKVKGTKLKASCKFTVKKKTAASQTTNTSTNKSSSAYDPEKIVSGMTIGWNLGNTLDSTGSWLSNKMDCETAWGNPKTTKAMIDAVKKAGFNTIRIPVSWGDHIDANANIDKQWLDRVQEVVDYAYKNDMYVILNSHHDLSWIKLDAANEKNVTKKLKNLWKQIAARFKDYDEKLLFEGLNEPRTIGSSKEWTGGTAAERKVLNSLYQTFVETVRSTGGNNKTRVLILTPYGANSSTETLKDLWLPEDDDRIAVSVHGYWPYMSAFDGNLSEKKLTDSGKKEIDNNFSNINKVLLSKGVPVIMDEFGSINKSNTEDRIEIAKYYLSVAEKYGVPCVWWDNGVAEANKSETFGLLNRKTLKWYFPELVEALVDSVK